MPAVGDALELAPAVKLCRAGSSRASVYPALCGLTAWVAAIVLAPWAGALGAEVVPTTLLALVWGVAGAFISRRWHERPLLAPEQAQPCRIPRARHERGIHAHSCGLQLAAQTVPDRSSATTEPTVTPAGMGIASIVWDATSKR